MFQTFVCNWQWEQIEELMPVVGGKGRPWNVHRISMNATRIPQEVGRPRTRPYALAADKGYSSQKNKHWLKNRFVRPIIPTKSNQKYDPKFCKTDCKKKKYRRTCVCLDQRGPEESLRDLKNSQSIFSLKINN